jgi:hypothetical protein
MQAVENLKEGQCTEQPIGSRRNRRLQRIRDYRQQALGQKDALTANLGAVASDLMLLQYRLSQALNGALAQTDSVMEDFAEWSPALQACLQLTRQIDRLANLDQRLGAKPGKPASAAARGKPREEQGD